MLNRLFQFIFAVSILPCLWLGYNTFADHMSPQEVSRAVLDYSAQSGLFVRRNLLGELTNTKITLEVIMVDEEMAYFSLPVGENLSSTLERIFEDTERVEFSQSEFPPYELGKLKLGRKGIYFFRTPADNFKIDPTAHISIPFQEVEYDPTALELARFITDRATYGGRRTFESQVDGITLVTRNFGTVVTIPGEPSTERLAHAIVGTEKNPERRAQKLLDFVTGEVEYDPKEKDLKIQVVKRANESLMVKSATCASLAVLYASLLEQVGQDYLLVYFPNHLTVFVEGNFGDQSYPHSIEVEGKRYFLAEATIPNFVIGVDLIDEGTARDSSSWTHLQRPSNRRDPEPR